MENRFSVRRVEGMEEGKASVGGGGGATDVFTATSTTCLVTEPRRRSSLQQLTLEALPRLDNYRQWGMKRPSLGALHGETALAATAEEREEDGGLPVGDPDLEPPRPPEHQGIKLGWIQGVLIPCLLNIWGVMLFLRLSWVVAQAGIGLSLVIIAISATVCVITTMSLSAICTNGEVKGGGIYFIISRSLGPEFGASVGIVFAFANAVAASMNTIGFCNSVGDWLDEYNKKIVDGDVNDVRIIGVSAIAVMIIICAVGMEWESKAQNFLIAIILAAMVDFVVGISMGPRSDVEKAQGFVGLSTDIFQQNWGPDYRYSEEMDQDFFSVFAIFFPSVTGIQAGANISGDLKDASMAIPKGTLLALLISMISYALFVLLAGAGALRDASGNVADLVNGTVSACAPHCQYGLQNSYTVMQLASAWGPLIYLGCFAATLSTALTNLLSVPRIIQAVGIDRIYPGLIFFSKGYGKAGEPYRGYVLTFLVSAGFLLIAKLNAVAPLISNFYLASYALINFCTFHAALIKPLGWRPTFKYYNTWLSLVGFFMCVAIMFLIDWLTSVITFVIIFALYLIVVYRKPDANWGSSTQAQTYKTALHSAYKLSSVGDHVKNYRPQLLALTGRPQDRPPLLGLASLITKGHALLICGDVLQTQLTHRARERRLRAGSAALRARRTKAFYAVVDGLPFEQGARALMQSAGIGKLRPNVLLMGYKQDWQSCPTDDLIAYFNVLHHAFDNRMAATILRMRAGLDYSRLIEEIEEKDKDHGSLSATVLRRADSSLVYLPSHGSDSDLSNTRVLAASASQLSVISSADSTAYLPTDSITPNRRFNVNNHSPRSVLKSKKRNLASQFATALADSGKEIPLDLLTSMTKFDTKQPKGTIDVWWLYDDGGLTILLPYIISTRSNWSSCRLRVFALANHKNDLDLEQKNMANLLTKFRIEYSSLTMVSGITEKPQPDTLAFFEKLIEGLKASHSGMTEEDLAAQEEKTYRQLRLREMLLKHSHDASLVVMSLPMPRVGVVSAPLYMAWLEVLTKDMPPFLLVRGNHTSVLTFYS
ncbi:bumetanide-sensitive sodium-(potassium)-chloride cotransporter [Schistocerca piceifrons]|uniref:bumetanide-sensitive sodium-(potassium)-chloride cotransporter n=1 Tax=Schistocerca piceifrons TaxID=274613 RepID=UPI001F5FD116|nr:bumetanide-sensitive sodium-(potassium)-chloride cotransporter [Schistocerca piceifrons]